jgi:hypothetical protein
MSDFACLSDKLQEQSVVQEQILRQLTDLLSIRNNPAPCLEPEPGPVRPASPIIHHKAAADLPLNRGYKTGVHTGFGGSRFTAYDAEEADNDSDYSSNHDSVGSSRRYRADERGNNLAAVVEAKRLKAEHANALDKYSKARPPLFNPKALDTWVHSIEAIMINLPNGAELV